MCGENHGFEVGACLSADLQGAQKRPDCACEPCAGIGASASSSAKGRTLRRDADLSAPTNGKTLIDFASAIHREGHKPRLVKLSNRESVASAHVSHSRPT